MFNTNSEEGPHRIPEDDVLGNNMDRWVLPASHPESHCSEAAVLMAQSRPTSPQATSSASLT